MKKIEHVAEWENLYNYAIDKITDDDYTRILLINADKRPNGIISIIKYPTRSYFSSPLLNWENLIRCSNYYGIPPEDRLLDGSLGYMCTAVQRHLKPAASVRIKPDDELIQQLRQDLPDDCLLLPYNEINTAFICRKGKLEELFDIRKVKDSYEQMGVFNINWGKVNDYCNKDISFFADNSASGITIESGIKDETEAVIVGLLLGYPIESTIAYFANSLRVENKILSNQAKKHFKTNSEPFIDVNQETWFYQDGNVFASWQQEKLYY